MNCKITSSHTLSADSKVVGATPFRTVVGRHWFALYTMSRHERSVLEKLHRHSVDAFFPAYDCICRWKKRPPISRQLPLFPGYVFARIAASERSRILAIPGVLSVVGSQSHAWPLDETIIEALQSRIHLHDVRPCTQAETGESVRIVEGPLVGLEGLLLRRKGNLRLVIRLHLIEKSIIVEVDEAAVEPS